MSKTRIGRNSIKESFDNLETGLCYFNKSGLPILVNRTMDNLAFEIIGRDLQYEEEFAIAVQELPDKLFFSENGRIWKFDINRNPEYGTEYIAADITGIYQDNLTLQKKNQELQKIHEAIEEIGKNYVAIAREEEILSMKMRIHGEMGKCVLNLQKYYQEGCPKDKRNSLIQELKNTVSLLKGEVGKTDTEEPLIELEKTAEAIGAKIHIQGEVPVEYEVRHLLVLSMRECLINAIRHAGGDTLFVTIEHHDDMCTTQITNNGQDPDEEIVEGGGLSSLRKKIERVNGSMQISSAPHFCLTVTIPVKEVSGL